MRSHHVIRIVVDVFCCFSLCVGFASGQQQITPIDGGQTDSGISQQRHESEVCSTQRELEISRIDHAVVIGLPIPPPLVFLRRPRMNSRQCTPNSTGAPNTFCRSLANPPLPHRAAAIAIV